MDFTVTYQTCSGSEITATVRAPSKADAMRQVAAHPDCDDILDCVQEG